jgi:hypothetical protein
MSGHRWRPVASRGRATPPRETAHHLIRGEEGAPPDRLPGLGETFPGAGEACRNLRKLSAASESFPRPWGNFPRSRRNLPRSRKTFPGPGKLSPDLGKFSAAWESFSRCIESLPGPGKLRRGRWRRRSARLPFPETKGASSRPQGGTGSCWGASSSVVASHGRNNFDIPIILLLLPFLSAYSRPETEGRLCGEGKCSGPGRIHEGEPS